ncbi:MAG TPA: hypothetical protein VF275_11530 [Gammaproteobacteria bacterium]
MPSNAWLRLSRALIYPLHVEASLIIGFGAVFLWIFSASLFGLVILLTVGTGVLQVLLANLRHCAYGGDTPPAITASEFLQFGAAPFKLLLVIATWLGFSASVQELWPQLPWVTWIFTLAGFGLLPAFATLLALEDRLEYALNPVKLFNFARRGGFLYLLLAAALGVTLYLAFEESRALSFDRELAAALVFHVPKAATLGWLVVGLYVATAVAHVLGSIAYETHDFAPPAGHEIPDTKKPAFDSPAVIAERLAGMLRREERDDALNAWQAQAEGDHVFQAALLDGLMRERAWGLVPRQAQRVISLKLAANRAHDALWIAMRMLNDFDSFTTSSADEWLALCRAANNRGEWLTLLASKAKEKFPNDEATLDIAMLQARHVANASDDPAGALAVLEPYLAWSTHPRHPELLRLHATFRTLLEI